MNEEILAGIKNAIAHGSSLDNAVKSFIAAGYKAEEVNEAAQSITSGTLTNMSKISQEVAQQPIIENNASKQMTKPAVPENKEKAPEASNWMKITILVLLLFIILFGIYMLVYS